MKYLILIIPLLIAVVQAQNFETGDNSTVSGCSTHCAYSDDSLSCWNKTLEFFERILLGQMRHYIAVQINIDQWHRRHDSHYNSHFEQAIVESNNTMQALITENDVIDSETVSVVVQTLIRRVQRESNKMISWVPHFICPIPCEYKYSIWKNLFIVSAILNICLLFVIFPFIRRMSRKQKTEALIRD
uniref:Uncharacterized protein n=1 Tax=Panagrolaimus sp. ES5 TaxID=591445 RepID=A0AC34GPS9_9BILA